MIAAVLAATTDDGVRAFVMRSTCGAMPAMAFVAVTIVSVRVLGTHVVDCAVAAPVEGVVHDAAGLRLIDSGRDESA